MPTKAPLSTLTFTWCRARPVPAGSRHRGAVPDQLDFRAHPGVEETLAVQHGHDVGRVENVSSDRKRPVAREPARLAAERKRENVRAADRHGVDLAAQPAFESRIPDGGIARRKQAPLRARSLNPCCTTPKVQSAAPAFA